MKTIVRNCMIALLSTVAIFLLFKSIWTSGASESSNYFLSFCVIAVTGWLIALATYEF